MHAPSPWLAIAMQAAFYLVTVVAMLATMRQIVRGLQDGVKDLKEWASKVDDFTRESATDGGGWESVGLRSRERRSSFQLARPPDLRRLAALIPAPAGPSRLPVSKGAAHGRLAGPDRPCLTPSASGSRPC